MILVGLDFADGSRAALDHARALSAISGFPVEAMHVTEYGEGDSWKPDSGQMEWLAKAGLRSSELSTRRGVPWVELIRYARERKAVLIVAGRNRDSGRQTSFLGSTASRLASQGPDPVLLVSAGPRVAVDWLKAPGQ